MSIWRELRDGVRQAIVLQERLERLGEDVHKMADRVLDHDRRLLRIETMIELAEKGGDTARSLTCLS